MGCLKTKVQPSERNARRQKIGFSQKPYFFHSLTFCGFAKERKQKHELSILHNSSISHFLFAKIQKKEIKMAYAVIELLTLNFALNPLFCKTDVGGCAVFIRLGFREWIFNFSLLFLQLVCIEWVIFINSPLVLFIDEFIN